MASKGSILVVDDNRLMPATLADGLTRAGYDVVDADNGDDAILLARAHRPDLALLDIRMKGKSGFDVARHLRSQQATPFMFFSAFSDDDTVAQVMEPGVVACFVQPLDIRQIMPADEAAFAAIEAGPRIAPPAHAQPARSRASNDPAETPVAMAAGVPMQRHSLNRDVALERLRGLAAATGRSMAAEAEVLLAAVEQLALS